MITLVNLTQKNTQLQVNIQNRGGGAEVNIFYLHTAPIQISKAFNSNKIAAEEEQSFPSMISDRSPWRTRDITAGRLPPVL